MRGIYQIRNTITGDCYIGMAQHIEQRWGHHRWALNAGKHHNHRLQNDWVVYGPEVFEFTILEEVKAPTTMYNAEARAIAERNPSYNIGATTITESKPFVRPMRQPGHNRRLTTTKTELACPCCGNPVDVEERDYDEAPITIIDIKRYDIDGNRLPEMTIYRLKD